MLQATVGFRILDPALAAMLDIAACRKLGTGILTVVLEASVCLGVTDRTTVAADRGWGGNHVRSFLQGCVRDFKLAAPITALLDGSSVGILALFTLLPDRQLV